MLKVVSMVLCERIEEGDDAVSLVNPIDYLVVEKFPVRKDVGFYFELAGVTEQITLYLAVSKETEVSGMLSATLGRARTDGRIASQLTVHDVKFNCEGEYKATISTDGPEVQEILAETPLFVRLGSPPPVAELPERPTRHRDG